jgi:translation initiation factor IF-2
MVFMVKQSTKEVIEKKASSGGPKAPPVVAILGHVDHGKTSILDHIRKTHVASKEVGGITQHISSYQVEHEGKKITFIDTPGHEAFSQIRARGAKITDIAILVVAADDGVMPQTKESISHIRTANIPYVVAINKIDLPGANIEKVKKQLAEEQVLVEGYGGDVVAVQVSAKTGAGISELLEMIHLVAELSEVKKDTSGEFEGVVIESLLDKFRGPLATIIVKGGILKVGDTIFGGSSSGKIKSIFDYKKERIKEATVSMPVQILGLESVPVVGDILSKESKEKIKTEPKGGESKKDWANLPKTSEINLILKADTYGSLEAISASIESLKTADQEVRFIHQETGDITENDVLLASSSKSIIIGFGVKVPNTVEKVAEEEGVNIRTYSLIYELLDELKEGLSALSESKKKKEALGEAEIVAKFNGEDGSIAGCKVIKGRINKEDSLEVLRKGKVLKETKIRSMKHKLLDINEAEEGKEFGVMFDSKVNFESGDIIQAVKN